MSDEMDELWSLFADDGAQAMDAMETALLALQDADPDTQAPHVAALFRAVHTFKGNSRVLGLGVIESRAHLAEDLIGLVRDSGVPLDAEILTLLLETGDRLRAMLDETAVTRADVAPEDTEELVARLADKIARARQAEGDPSEQTFTDQTVDPAEGEPLTEAAPVASADPAPEDDLPPAPDAQHEAVAAESSQAAPPSAVAPTEESRTRLADDPAYLAILLEMAGDTLKKLQKVFEDGAPDAARNPVANLAHAARQLGLDAWSTVLEAFPDHPTPDDLQQIINDVAKLMAAQTQSVAKAKSEDTADQDAAGFFAALSDPLAVIARLGIGLAVGEVPDAGVLSAAAQRVGELADVEGYVRVSAVARALISAKDLETFRRTELRLYEELASVEAVLPKDQVTPDLSPAILLASWAADHVFDTLDELDATLEKLRQGKDIDASQRALERLVRLVHHACRHYNLEMASQLAMSLLDLFGRGHARGQAPDAILMRIARGFVDTLELVFDALREGETPDTDRLEALFNEASEASFAGSGVMTASAIERRLGLPREFHRVMSPESVRAASDALTEGLGFYILRADVNTDNTLAEALFGFIGSGAVRAITNVTVFQGEDTLFDFLLASPLSEVELTEALAWMDPGGRRLMLTTTLQVDTEADDDLAEPKVQPDMAAGNDLTVGVLERIGELAAGQAMVHSMLSELAENDLSNEIETSIKKLGDVSPALRGALNGLAEQTMGRLRDLLQLETQLLAQMSELQQITADLRSRPVETVLRPLAALATAQARQNGLELQLTSTGGDMTLDVALLDQLKRILRPLVLARVAAGLASARKIHLAVNRDDDRLSVTMEDDGTTPHDTAALEALRAELVRGGGSLRVIQRPGGGYRLHLGLPMSLVVLEGMVVGVGETRYIIPLDSIRTILQPDPNMVTRISADGGERWLRLDRDEIVPIRPLPRVMPREEDAARQEVHVVLKRGADSVSVPVDHLIGQQLVLLRPLRGVMSGMRNATGVALLSGGDVGIVLSPGTLCGAVEDRQGIRA